MKIRRGAIVDNVVTYVYAKFGDDRLWNEKALAYRKSDNNNNKNNVRSHGGPVSESNKLIYEVCGAMVPPVPWRWRHCLQLDQPIVPTAAAAVDYSTVRRRRLLSTCCSTGRHDNARRAAAAGVEYVLYCVLLGTQLMTQLIDDH